jgi:hypothetical protein
VAGPQDRTLEGLAAPDYVPDPLLDITRHANSDQFACPVKARQFDCVSLVD